MVKKLRWLQTVFHINKLQKMEHQKVSLEILEEEISEVSM